ncbi:LacI family DNA-binding transcriptional regulator [Salibacterium qingdaonense]|uniref:Transcriptional regulator, LacI family n=1 Tax=Salibacterium qingdaonense TaxID=266892 RepID=A0A1I4P0S9_9BACI|nr:LacI family DNA-binding transcriptional regulator [Salibacterium qingdaonense]SFM21411.1 transcriptional regulator, LacI family [Salibacterium qingdaonense]
MKVTMKKIAEEVGVSVTTVSHVVNGTKKISSEKYNQIMEIIRKHNYVPNYSAKNLRSQSTKTAGLIVPSFPDSYVTGYINSISRRAKEMGYNLLFINTDEDVDYEQETLKLLHSNMVDGIILSPSAKMEESESYSEELLDSSLPIVLISRYHEAFQHSPFVTQDDFQAGYDAAIHLLQHGHRDIGLIYAVSGISPTKNRINGYKKALEEYGVSFNENYLEKGHATVEGSRKAVKSLLEKNKEITALFVLSDLMTIGTISGLKEMNKKIPDEVALIGFGDFPSAPIMDPPVTNISLSPDTLGQTAFDLLLNKINNPGYDKTVHIPNFLITRKSCGC